MIARETILARFAAGEISREIALAQLLLGGAVPALDGLPAPIADLARDHEGRLAGLAALARDGFEAAGDDPLAATAALFDRLAVAAPEAGVAFYTLGSPELLDEATDELVAVIRAWAPPAGRHVVDFGCGIGRVAIALAAEAASMVGLDVSAGMVAEAGRRAGERPALTFRVTDGDRLPVPDGGADLVIAADSLPFAVRTGAAYLDQLFGEFARVLRSGGDLLVFNWSYRGDLAADVADAHRLAAAHGFVVARAGERPFRLWDGTGFHLRRA